MSLRSLGFAIAVGSFVLVGCKRDPVGASKGDGATALADGGKPKSGPVNELPIPKETVEMTINADHRPEYTGLVGVVEGTVYVTGDPAPPSMGKNFDRCPEAAAVYSKTFREGPPLPNGSRPLADAAVGITGYGVGDNRFVVSEKRPTETLTISNCAFGARTVAMTFGQALEVKNVSAATIPLYAPYFENQPSTAVLIATQGGDPIRLYPKSLGRYRLLDRLGNTWLEADVYVSGNPLHTVTDVKGHYRVEGVPVGKLNLEAFHPAIAVQFKKEVEIRDGVVTTMDITIANDKAAVQPPSHPLKPLMK
jgi:hypothetical protein